jgi:hypothetical protein
MGGTSTLIDGEDRSAEVQELTPPPKTEAGVESMLEEATLVEGTHLGTMCSYYVE